MICRGAHSRCAIATVREGEYAYLSAGGLEEDVDVAAYLCLCQIHQFGGWEEQSVSQQTIHPLQLLNQPGEVSKPQTPFHVRDRFERSLVQCRFELSEQNE